MKILECSSIGDKRFSALFANVIMFDKKDIIESHYQLSKRFGDFVPQHWTEVKGKQSIVKDMTLTHFVVNGIEYDLEYLHQWYHLMWLKYLDSKPKLVEYAGKFDDFNDVFKGKSGEICQADSIRIYIKQGREALLKECEEFLKLMGGT